METLKNGKYRAKVYINGKPYTKVFTRKTDAERWRFEKTGEKEQVEAYGAPLVSEILFGDFTDLWLKRKSSLAPRSTDNYRAGIKNHLRPLFGHIKLRHMRMDHGQELISHLQKTDLSSSRINFYLRVFKQLFFDAERWEYLPRNPFRNLSKLKENPRVITYWLPEEVRQFLDANRDHDYFSLFLVALNTGLRRGELLGLMWDKVDFLNRQIIISRTKDRYGVKETTKTGRVRFVPMNETVIKTLQNLKKENRSELVFVGKDGLAPDFEHVSSRLFSRAIKKAQVKKIRFHDLRSTYAANFCMAGGDIYALSKILGHTKVEMTSQKYAHLHPKYLSQVSEIINFDTSPELSSQVAHELKLKIVS